MLIERGTIVGSHRIGGMGAVYSATHVDYDRQVALKVLADELSSSQQNFLDYFVDGDTSVMDELCGVLGA